MVYKTIKITAASILLSGLLLLLWLIFVPRSYTVPPFENRADEQYWDLPTGSRIGYAFVPAKGVKQPYPIIFLQGGPGSWIGDATLNMLAPLSENGFDVYLYDQIGAGHSGRLADIREYTADRHKRDLEAIVQQIGTEKVILIGQSWGAILATLFVADNPGSVEKLILTGPGPIYPVNQTIRNVKAPDSLQLKNPLYTNRQGNEKMNTLRTRAMSWFATTFGKKIASEKEADAFEALLSHDCRKSCVCDTTILRHSPVTSGSGFYVSVMTVKSLTQIQDPRPKIQGLPIPLLLMRGQCDNQLWGYQAEYLDLFPKHQLAVFPDAGHVIALEQPELYLKTLRTFLGK